MIRTQEGRDIWLDVMQSADTAGIPARLLLACLIAESNLREQAERWGGSATNALGKQAADRRDLEALQAIIDQAWPDISFGLGQRIVKYHWTGDRSPTAQNCLNVRATVWANPARDIWEAAKYLRTHYLNAGQADLGPVDGDRELMALCAYNAGHVPQPTEDYWTKRVSTVKRYRECLAQAGELLAAEERTEPMTDIEKRAAEATIRDKLGNALTEEMPASECVVKAYDNAALLYIPGAGTYVLAEATVADKFRSAPE